MIRLSPADVARIAQDGVILAGRHAFVEEHEKFDFAFDAQPQLVTQANAGIPAFLTTMIDPEVIRVVVAPMRIAEVFGEQKKGTWTDDAIQFPIVESAGFVTSYGDWNNNGNAGVNISWTPRQPYFYQTVTQYGERELERYGRARLNLVSELDAAAALAMNQFQNASYAFGVSGLQNYGVLNEPSLLPPVVPTTKAAGGTSWDVATQQEIFNDFLKLFGQLQTQMNGNIKQTDTIVVALSPGRLVRLSQISQFGISVLQSVAPAFPNIRFEPIPEYSTASGEVMQMFLPTYQGTQTMYVAFPEKMRLFPTIASLSGWQQKKAGGTWGAILRRPIALATMIGI